MNKFQYAVWQTLRLSSPIIESAHSVPILSQMRGLDGKA